MFSGFGPPIIPPLPFKTEEPREQEQKATMVQRLLRWIASVLHKAR